MAFALTLIGAMIAPVLDGVVFHAAGQQQVFGSEFDGPNGSPNHGAHCLLYNSIFTRPFGLNHAPAPTLLAVAAAVVKPAFLPLPSLSGYSGFDLPQRAPPESTT
ncbi:MAG TPA: hypothetical protein VMG41_00270 [Gemmatimonadales bacterium]|nr:hypothetical protein [Gemmatimonadales bacterium]